MVEDVQESDYIALAELRLRIREFLRGSDEASRQAGLEPQQYQLLLALRAVADPSQATIGRLAESLHLKHHSVVGLVDRLEARGFVRRRRNADNRREVRVVLLAPGRDAVRNVVSQRLHELRGSGRALVESIAAVLNSNQAEKASSSS